MTEKEIELYYRLFTIGVPVLLLLLTVIGIGLLIHWLIQASKEDPEERIKRFEEYEQGVKDDEYDIVHSMYPPDIKKYYPDDYERWKYEYREVFEPYLDKLNEI